MPEKYSFIRSSLGFFIHVSTLDKYLSYAKKEMEHVPYSQNIKVFSLILCINGLAKEQ